MRISTFGLGYVGCVTTACLAREGHEVVGVDVNPVKLDLLRSGRSPVVEPGLEELVAAGVAQGLLRVSDDTREAVHGSEISLICVGTPSNPNGSLNLRYAENVCREIGQALASKRSYHTVVVRSTVLPGTVIERLIPILEQSSGLRAGHDFGVCMHPEFLREGTAIKDYLEPSLIVIGELDSRSGDALAALYPSARGSLLRVAIQTAEMVKYTSNAFHALKVTFANEIGNLCKAQAIDGREVMQIVGQDRVLNISTAYLKPGFAFGGSCLPKDLRALLYRAKAIDVDCPVLNAVLPSNQRQIELGIRLVENTGRKKVGIVGLSFKPGTDDLRESPAITLAETLLGRGYEVRVFDDKLQLNRLLGANKAFLDREIPHIASLMCSSLEDLVGASDVLVVTNASRAFLAVPDLLRADQVLIDLVGQLPAARLDGVGYEGIAW
jgi:GDP-mannose 6-dehydrogenase